MTRDADSGGSSRESGEESPRPEHLSKRARTVDRERDAEPSTRWTDDAPSSAGPSDQLPVSRSLEGEADDATAGVSRWADADEDDAAAADGDGEARPDDSETFGLVPQELAAEEENVALVEADAQPKRLDMLQQCRDKDEVFEIIKEVGAGTYGLVSKARNKQTNEIKALKKIKLPPTFAADGFPMTSVREINLLLALDHPHIVSVSEIVVSKKRDVYMVMEFVQQDLKAFMSKYKARLKVSEVKRIVRQLLEGVRYLHENWVLHRDLKPANVLYDHFGNIKICDFGLARHYGDPVPLMTPTVVTPTYRGPEICLGVRDYTPALDLWSVGVMAAELITGKAPFIEYKSEIDLVNAIGRVIGSPHGRWEGLEGLPAYRKLEIARGVPSTLRQRLGVQSGSALPLALDTALTECGYELVERLMCWDPKQRLTAAQALAHPWFSELPRETQACFMPQTNDALRRKYV